ncbi:transcriptional repressor LexA [Alkaliphilus peptidifermentans]|uniref:SOS regulatory protein LexA n=1 Tax=Alkaliphilus peptidifermentans DSM 18978 TaxID=1120976 RepID=A0A1G5JZY2_9FIRM|nr:transcriptional repressor LexA [Alkaliphilus peptidifermentans]SCY93328.1 SOS regulatory protein LexA [Alkaliphilus peptidifermentans DSM 18978]
MIGRRIKELRGNCNITQEELSKIIGVSTSMVGMYETEARNPSYEVLLRIAEYFKVSTDYILGKTNFKFYEDEEIKNVEMLIDSIANSKSDDIKILSKDILELLHLTTYDSISGNRVKELTFIKKLYYIIYKLQNTLSNNAYKRFTSKNNVRLLSQDEINNITSDLKNKFNNLSDKITDYYFDEETWRQDLNIDIDSFFCLNSEYENFLLKPVTGKIVKVPVLGRIPAGNPIDAEENIIDYVEIPESEISNGSYFYLQVTGDSMIGSGIMDGYRVLVKKQPDVENGEIAVIRVNSTEATLKRVKKIDGQVILYPDNPKYDPIFINNSDAEIIGKVVKVEFDPNKKY